MILFAEDWKRYPRATYDLTTTNSSFLQVAEIYEDMGIKNNLFLLSIMQPELIGVNPFEKGLPLEICARIALEIRWNPWYYFREIARLPSGGDSVRFIANRGNIASFWCYFNHIDYCNIQPRQTFKSGSTDCLTCGLIYAGMTKGAKIVMITKDATLRQDNVERLKAIRDLLPPWLYIAHADDADNQKELTCNHWGNKLLTGVARSSPMAAENLGRGLTAATMHFDEGPFITHFGKTVAAALPGTTRARAIAAANNQPYGSIFTTTSGKMDSRDGRYMYDMIMGGTPWDEMFLDCRNVNDLKRMMRVNSSGEKEKLTREFMNITMSHRQLGYSDAWLFETMAQSKSRGEEADRDFLNIWTAGSMRSPLSALLNDSIRMSEIDPTYREVAQGPDPYILRWFIPREEIEERMVQGRFVLGCDTSDAVGRDAITLVLTDLHDLSTVAVGTYNETLLPRFASFVCALLVRFKNVTFIPERKSSAQTLIDALLLQLPAHNEDPFKRIYNSVVDEARENPQEFQEIQKAAYLRNEAFYERRKKLFGFNTTKDSRALLYGTVLQNAAKQAGHMVRDKVLSSEIRQLVEKNGRIDHAASGHDDHVIAWLLTHFFAHHGKNLHHYGIEPGSILVNLGNEGKAMSPEERDERERQREMGDEFEGLIARLKGDLDDLTAMKYEHRLQVLSMRMDRKFDIEGPSLDAMIRQAGEERRKRQHIQVQQRRFRPNEAFDALIRGGNGNRSPLTPDLPFSRTTSMRYY